MRAVVRGVVRGDLWASVTWRILGWKNFDGREGINYFFSETRESLPRLALPLLSGKAYQTDLPSPAERARGACPAVSALSAVVRVLCFLVKSSWLFSG